MIGIIQHLMNGAGPWLLVAIFLVVALESSAFLGLIFPGEAAALIAGALVGAGVLAFWWAFGTVAGGAIIGDIGGYVLGRWKGEALLARWNLARRQHEHHRRRLESYFARWGSATVIVGRFVAVGRAFVPFTAGLYRMPAKRFVPMAVVAGVVWGAIVVALGYLLGAQWRLVEGWLRSVGLGMLILLVATVAAIALWRWLVRRQDEFKAAWQRHIAQRYGIELEPLLAFARERLSPAGYLGLHLTAGLAVLGSLAWLFGGVTQDIFAQDPLVHVDRAIALFIAGHRTATLNTLMAGPIFLGTIWPMVAVAIGTAAGLAFAGDGILAATAGPISASAYGVGIALRALFSLVSPNVPAPELVHGFNNFPSVAMVAATAVYGLAGYALAMHGRGWLLQTLGAVAALYVILLTGIGATYRGEFVSAVTGGFAAGGCWLAICVTGIVTYQKLRASPEPHAGFS